MNPEGFWFIVKASRLAQGPGQQQILDYGRKKYIRYHGSEDGWADIVKQAQASTGVMPPAGFTVAAAPPPPSPAEQAADLVKSKDPKQMSFAEWQLVLSSGNAQAADTVFNAIKDKAVKLVANVITASPTKLTLAGSADDIDDKKADINLTMDKGNSGKVGSSRGHADAVPGYRFQLHAQSVHADHDRWRAAGQERQSGWDGRRSGAQGTGKEEAIDEKSTGNGKRELRGSRFSCLDEMRDRRTGPIRPGASEVSAQLSCRRSDGRALLGGRRVPCRKTFMSSSSSAIVRLRVLRCMPNWRAVLHWLPLFSCSTVRMNRFLNSRTASE